MRCYVCDRETESNALARLNESEFDRVVARYSLIHVQGTDDNFDENDSVVLCAVCAGTQILTMPTGKFVRVDGDAPVFTDGGQEKRIAGNEQDMYATVIIWHRDGVMRRYSEGGDGRWHTGLHEIDPYFAAMLSAADENIWDAYAEWQYADSRMGDSTP
jgi:hypothetical protein